MEREEFKTLVKAMKAVYTRQDFIPDQDAFNVWYELLKDLDYRVANIAVQKHMYLSKFPPTPADIREQAAGILAEKSQEWADGWGEVLMAIRRYGRYNEDKALESMSDTTRRVVERLGFQELCNSENQMADRANFRMIYEQEEERKKKEGVMPAYLKDIISKIQIGMEEQKQIGVKNDAE